jgi:hypothetical protein
MDKLREWFLDTFTPHREARHLPEGKPFDSCTGQTEQIQHLGRPRPARSTSLFIGAHDFSLESPVIAAIQGDRNNVIHVHNSGNNVPQGKCYRPSFMS